MPIERKKKLYLGVERAHANMESMQIDRVGGFQREKSMETYHQMISFLVNKLIKVKSVNYN